MKELSDKILVGSTYFFSDYVDFCSKDFDYAVIVEPNDEFKFFREIHITHKKCIFQIVKNDPKDIIERINKGTSPMQIGKFLVPEFNKEIGFKYGDLFLLEPSIERLDEKHTYERIIYEAYKKNGDFVLTQEQRDEAFEEYMNTRND